MTDERRDVIDVLVDQDWRAAMALEEFLAFTVLALMRRGALFAEDVTMALEAQQHVIELALDRGEDPTLQAAALEGLCARICDVCAQARIEPPSLRPWRKAPFPDRPMPPAND